MISDVEMTGLLLPRELVREVLESAFHGGAMNRDRRDLFLTRPLSPPMNRILTEQAALLTSGYVSR